MFSLSLSLPLPVLLLLLSFFSVWGIAHPTPWSRVNPYGIRRLLLKSLCPACSGQKPSVDSPPPQCIAGRWQTSDLSPLSTSTARVFHPISGPATQTPPHGHPSHGLCFCPADWNPGSSFPHTAVAPVRPHMGTLKSWARAGVSLVCLKPGLVSDLSQNCSLPALLSLFLSLAHFASDPLTDSEHCHSHPGPMRVTRAKYQMIREVACR